MINISRVEEIDFLKDSRILRQSSWSSFFLQMLPPLYCIVSSVSSVLHLQLLLWRGFISWSYPPKTGNSFSLSARHFCLGCGLILRKHTCELQIFHFQNNCIPSNHLSNASGLAFSWLLQPQIWAENWDSVSLQTLDWFRLYFSSPFGLENRKTGFHATIQLVSPFQKGKEHMKPSFIFPVMTRKPISILTWLEQTN